MSFARYPEYKESGVPWLGDVPAHWTVNRLKRACEVYPSNVDKKSYEGEASVLLCNYTDVYYNERIVAGMDFMAATAADDQIEKFTLRAGDTIITKDSETADDIAIAAYVPRDLPGVICGYHLSMVRPRNGVHGAFVKRVFDSHYARAKFEVAANGLTRVGLSQYAVDNVELPWPSHAEQVSIATFLDRETSKIDGLVAEQEKLIALLQEKRQAVISHAVTKGLDPTVPMKDSGVEWLGEVPAHWSVGALSYLATIETGSTPDRANAAYWDGPIPWIKTGEINWEPIFEADESITDLGLANSSCKLAKAGTLLMAMYGQGATRGRVAVLAIDATYNQACAAISFTSRVATDFAKFFFMAAYSHIRDNGNETSQMNLGAGVIGKIKMMIPSLDEQGVIAEYLAHATAKLDTLTAEAQSAIKLLQERRTTLISAAVTGQIDVRNVANTN